MHVFNFIRITAFVLLPCRLIIIVSVCQCEVMQPVGFSM